VLLKKSTVEKRLDLAGASHLPSLTGATAFEGSQVRSDLTAQVFWGGTRKGSSGLAELTLQAAAPLLCPWRCKQSQHIRRVGNPTSLLAGNALWGGGSVTEDGREALAT
jgi:hypothetical protein